MIPIKVGMDFSRVLGDLDLIARQAGVSLQFVCEDQMRLWCNWLIGDIHPRSKGIGKKAVAKDANKIFAAVPQGTLFKMFEAQRTGRDFGAATINVSGNLTAMRAYHAQRRSRGRVRYNAGVIAQFGKMRVWDKMYVDRASLKRFIALASAAVGRLKAGWLPAADRWASRVNASAFMTWARGTAHSEGTSGGMISSDGSGSIFSTNSVPYAAAEIKPERIAFGQRLREADAEKRLEKRIDDLVARFDRGGV